MCTRIEDEQSVITRNEFSYHSAPSMRKPDDQCSKWLSMFSFWSGIYRWVKKISSSFAVWNLTIVGKGLLKDNNTGILLLTRDFSAGEQCSIFQSVFLVVAVSFTTNMMTAANPSRGTVCILGNKNKSSYFYFLHSLNSETKRGVRATAVFTKKSVPQHSSMKM